MTKIGKNLTKNQHIGIFLHLNKKDVHILGSRRRLQRALQTRCFFVFVLFLGTILISLDPDLDLQTPLNLDSF
jgi:hypothetical protein